jgi:hypothetical protein
MRCKAPAHNEIHFISQRCTLSQNVPVPEGIAGSVPGNLQSCKTSDLPPNILSSFTLLQASMELNETVSSSVNSDDEIYFRVSQ